MNAKENLNEITNEEEQEGEKSYLTMLWKVLIGIGATLSVISLGWILFIQFSSLSGIREELGKKQDAPKKDTTEETVTTEER